MKSNRFSKKTNRALKRKQLRSCIPDKKEGTSRINQITLRETITTPPSYINNDMEELVTRATKTLSALRVVVQRPWGIYNIGAIETTCRAMLRSLTAVVMGDMTDEELKMIIRKLICSYRDLLDMHYDVIYSR